METRAMRESSLMRVGGQFTGNWDEEWRGAVLSQARLPRNGSGVAQNQLNMLGFAGFAGFR
jgi:hypothetical protein